MRFRCSAISFLLTLVSLMLEPPVSAAEDDVVIDLAAVTSAETPAEQIRFVRLQQGDAAVAQLQAEIEPQVSALIERIRTECSLTDDQSDRLRLAAKQDIRHWIRMVSNRAQPMLIPAAPEAAELPISRITIAPGFLLRGSAFSYKVLTKHISIQQRIRLDAFKKRETEASRLRLRK